jgi:hypothetical protein
MLHTQLAALALAVAALAVSGCGSSKSKSTTSAASATTSATATATVPPVSTTPVKVSTGVPLSQTRWIAEANAICQNTATKLVALDAHTQAQLANQLPLAASYYTIQAEELAKLVPPKSMANDWQKVIDDIHLFSEYADQAAQDIKTTHKVENPALAKAARSQRQAIAIITHDGLTHCARIG